MFGVITSKLIPVAGWLGSSTWSTTLPSSAQVNDADQDLQCYHMSAHQVEWEREEVMHVLMRSSVSIAPLLLSTHHKMLSWDFILNFLMMLCNYLLTYLLILFTRSRWSRLGTQNTNEILQQFYTSFSHFLIFWTRSSISLTLINTRRFVFFSRLQSIDKTD